MRVYNSNNNGWEMSSEDLDAWSSTFQVCIARVLDDGADAVHVLDHLAKTIASAHIPTHASATRIAELMLGQLEALAQCGTLRTVPVRPRRITPSEGRIRGANGHQKAQSLPGVLIP